MSIVKFLSSKTFLKNILAAIVLMVIFVFLFKIFLGYYTNHNEYHLVPELRKKTFEQAQQIIKEREMNIEIIDTLAYNPDYPKFSIVEQNPRVGDKVKIGRKIYVKINRGSYSNIALPNIFGKTKRQASSLLRASGFGIGKIIRRPYFAEIVLGAKFRNQKLKSGMKLPKTSKIDLIIGDGNARAEDGSNAGHNEKEVNQDIKKTLNNVIGK